MEVEVLVTREQNADGMVTISCRALELRKSWDKVRKLESEGKAVKVLVNGFNRGGVTCDLEGLRGFIPRSQLERGEEHEEEKKWREGEGLGKDSGICFFLLGSVPKQSIGVILGTTEIGHGTTLLGCSGAWESVGRGNGAT